MLPLSVSCVGAPGRISALGHLFRVQIVLIRLYQLRKFRVQFSFESHQVSADLMGRCEFDRNTSPLIPRGLLARKRDKPPRSSDGCSFFARSKNEPKRSRPHGMTRKGPLRRLRLTLQGRNGSSGLDSYANGTASCGQSHNPTTGLSRQDQLFDSLLSIVANAKPA